MSQKYLLKKIFLSRGHRVHGCEKRKKNVPYFFFSKFKQSLVRSSNRRKMLHQFSLSYVQQNDCA